MSSALESCLEISESEFSARLYDCKSSNSRRNLVRRHLAQTPILNREVYVEFYPFTNGAGGCIRTEPSWTVGKGHLVFSTRSSSKYPKLKSLVVSGKLIPLERIKFFGLVK